MKIDMSKEAVIRRLEIVAQLRSDCSGYTGDVAATDQAQNSLPLGK